MDGRTEIAGGVSVLAFLARVRQKHAGNNSQHSMKSGTGSRKSTTELRK